MSELVSDERLAELEVIVRRSDIDFSSRVDLYTALRELQSLRAQCARVQRDAQRFEWFFGDSDKLPFMSNYLLGIREAWTPDQWRASIDAAMAAKSDDWLTREARQIGLHSPACASVRFGQNECDCGAKP